MQVRETFLASISTCDWKWQGTLNLSWQRLIFKLIHCCVGVIWVEVLSHKAAWLVQSIRSFCFGSVGPTQMAQCPVKGSVAIKLH